MKMRLLVFLLILAPCSCFGQGLVVSARIANGIFSSDNLFAEHNIAEIPALSGQLIAKKRQYHDASVEVKYRALVVGLTLVRYRTDTRFIDYIGRGSGNSYIIDVSKMAHIGYSFNFAEFTANPSSIVLGLAGGVNQADSPIEFGMTTVFRIRDERDGVFKTFVDRNKTVLMMPRNLKVAQPFIEMNIGLSSFLQLSARASYWTSLTRINYAQFRGYGEFEDHQEALAYAEWLINDNTPDKTEKPFYDVRPSISIGLKILVPVMTSSKMKPQRSTTSPAE